jgi:hypothetical protein
MLRVPVERELLPMRCRSCDAESVRLVIDLGDQPLCNRLVKPGAADPPSYPLRLGYCENCTLLQIDATIPRDDMFREYVYVSGTTDTLRRHFIETTHRLRETYDIRSGYRASTDDFDFVVDIGSNDGTWLKTWGAQQLRLGVEPAIDIARQANADGVRTVNAYFNLPTALNILSVHGKAKLITSAGSFFHMEDLHGACDGVRELLADDGVFVCQAISGEDMIRGNAFDQVLHEHLCYYTPESFERLMERHGLQLFDLKHHAIHGGTWEYHVRRPAGLSWKRYNGPTIREDEPPAFARRIQALEHSLLATLLNYQRAGKTVWAYGAPGKGGTLLNSFGIGPDLVRCATEKNPLKFGLEIPGCRVPIVAEGLEKPDAFLVLAWNFLDEFLAKERDWLAGGGEFIVPVPAVRIVTG